MKNEFDREVGKQTSALYNQCFIVNFLDRTFCERQLLIGSRWSCGAEENIAIKELDSSDVVSELSPFSQQYKWNVKKGVEGGVCLWGGGSSDGWEETERAGSV